MGVLMQESSAASGSRGTSDRGKERLVPSDSGCCKRAVSLREDKGLAGMQEGADG